MSTKSPFKTYSSLSNAKRAAKAAKLADGTFTVKKLSDGKAELLRTVEAAPAPIVVSLATGTIVPNRKAEREAAKQLKADRERADKASAKAAKAATAAAKAKRAPATPAVHITSSTIDHPVKRVWHIADEMKGAKRKEVLEACAKAGIAFYTARTQYQLWRSMNKAAAKKK